MDAVETGVVAVADDMTGLSRAHRQDREHKGRDQQDDAGAAREAGRETGRAGRVWKGGRVAEGKGSPAAWGRNFSDRCRFGGPRSARWCNSPASEPVSWGDPEIAASSQPGERERDLSNLEMPKSPQGFGMLAHIVVLGASSHGMMGGQEGDQ